MDEQVVRSRAVVRGRVQGVGFRYAAAETAARLGVTGYAHNRSDAAVEVEAEGTPDAVERFVEWLHEGPPTARVRSVEVSTAATLGSVRFETR
jgi:acylphosphatase